MIKVRRALTATAVSVLLLGGLIAPAIAQTSDEPCGPYTGVACPDPQDPNGEAALPDEEPSEVEGELIEADESPEAEPVVTDEAVADGDVIDEEGIAAPGEPRVLGAVLARTGVEAWMLSLVGVLLIGGGIAMLTVRRHRSSIDG